MPPAVTSTAPAGRSFAAHARSPPVQSSSMPLPQISAVGVHPSGSGGGGASTSGAMPAGASHVPRGEQVSGVGQLPSAAHGAPACGCGA
jgi:hypothetical protein